MNRWQSLLVMWVACCVLDLGALAGEIHEAVGKGDVVKVTSLLKSNPLLANAPGDDFRKFPPLMIAVEGRRTNMVEVLLKLGADINGTNRDNETALYRASMWGHADMVKLLLVHKADVNAGAKSGRSPALEVAALNAHKAAVELLVAHGAKVDAGYVAYIEKVASDPILEKPEQADKKKAFQQVIELLRKSTSDKPPAPAK
jgi:ankyrin repeat protein